MTLTQSSLQNLQQTIKGCRDCELGCTEADGRYYAPTPPSGPITAEIVVIGRNPGQVEERLGQPMLGPAGMIFTQFLDLCEVPRDSVYFTNLAMCFANKGRVPTADEYDSCTKWKKLEFALLKPKLVILLGNDVMHYFYPSRYPTSVLAHLGEHWKGFEKPGYEGNFKVIAFPHPGYYLNNKEKISVEWGVASTIVKTLVRILDIKTGT